MVKPFSIQAPEEIAKAYGGDKQKIIHAAQLGIVDPTAAILAGMFIDKMRTAQMREQVPQTTVAQDVMGGARAPAAMQAPPAAPPPSSGLGAISQGAPSMTPPAQPPMGMAEGGMVPPYASGGGLSDAPIPATMFDEPDNGGYDDGYAGGGLVAFAGGGDTTPTAAPVPSPAVAPTPAVAPAPAPITNPLDAFSPDRLQAMQTTLSGLAPQTNKYTDLLMQDVDRRRSPEYMASERKQVANQALMNFGLALMASKNPNFFGAIGEAGMPAVAQMGADLKDLKKQAHDAIVEGAQAEGMKNEAATKLANLTLEQATHVATLQSGTLDRESRERTEKLARDTQMEIARLQQSAETYRTQLQVSAQRDVARINSEQRMDKGLEGLMNSYLQMGVNEAKAKKIPVDMPALKARAYELALAQWNKYKTAQSGMLDVNNNGIPDNLENRPGISAPGGQQDVVNVPWPH